MAVITPEGFSFSDETVTNAAAASLANTSDYSFMDSATSTPAVTTNPFNINPPYRRPLREIK